MFWSDTSVRREVSGLGRGVPGSVAWEHAPSIRCALRAKAAMMPPKGELPQTPWGGHTFWCSANSWLLRVQEPYCCYQIVHHLHTELRHLIWGHKPQLWAPRKNPKVRWHFGGETETKHGSGLATDRVRPLHCCSPRLTVFSGKFSKSSQIPRALLNLPHKAPHTQGLGPKVHCVLMKPFTTSVLSPGSTHHLRLSTMVSTK